MPTFRLRIGDVFAIPLLDGREGYGQYVFRDRKWGHLVRVFDHIASGSEGSGRDLLECLDAAGTLFGPVFVAFGDAFRSGRWQVKGRLPVRDFCYPGFLNVLRERYQPRGNWSYWNGEKKVILGPVLPREYYDVEILVSWDPCVLSTRIATGENPYGDMVRKAAVG